MAVEGMTELLCIISRTFLKACRFSVRKCGNSLFWRKRCISNWETAQEKYWLFRVKLTMSDDFSWIDTSGCD